MEPASAPTPTTSDSKENQDPNARKIVQTAARTDFLVESANVQQKSMESAQLRQALQLASTRSSLLLEAENRLTIAQGRVKSLERAVDERDKQLRDERVSKSSSPRKDDNILSITIASLQNLLLEKDTTLSRYQDLLRTERQTRATAFDDHRTEVKQLQNIIEQLELKCKLANRETAATREKLLETKSAEKLINSSSSPIRLISSHMNKITFEEVAAAASDPSCSTEHQLPDKYIEDMFLDDRVGFEIDGGGGGGQSDLRTQLMAAENEVTKLQSRLRDVSNREGSWERGLTEKDKEIAVLMERLNKNDRTSDVSADATRRHEMEHLREMLDEKDRHIADLTETLNHFHDDQQKFINDTSLHSAEQVSQLSADLNRCEATNRIMNTQLDALKRQLANISQREAQAREVIKTLKTQLIRRPVISVKTAADRTSSAREEQLQKRALHLENELQQTKEELRKQASVVQSRRTKDAAELGLWNKQKRFQQLADSLKEQLGERDAELERVRQHFSTAKATIARLEREKQLLETRANRSGRYCQSSSCPSLHATASKYTPAESPESYDLPHHRRGGAAGENVSISSHSHAQLLDISDGNQEVLDALKGRIEQQQRRIVAMELEGRGASAIGHELEKLQEKCSNFEALNVRLEAKNLHLQLDNDMLRQGDHGEKTKRQIKHLEE